MASRTFWILNHQKNTQILQLLNSLTEASAQEWLKALFANLILGTLHLADFDDSEQKIR